MPMVTLVLQIVTLLDCRLVAYTFMDYRSKSNHKLAFIMYWKIYFAKSIHKLDSLFFYLLFDLYFKGVLEYVFFFFLVCFWTLWWNMLCQVSISFDIIFMCQRFVLYPNKKAQVPPKLIDETTEPLVNTSDHKQSETV